MGKDLEGRELGKGIIQRPDGRYYARATVCGKTISLYGHDLQALRQQLEEKMKQEQENGKRDPQVEAWFFEWFERYKQPDVKHTSVRPMKNRVLNTIMPYIRKKRISKLTPDDVRDAVNQALDSGIPRGSVREALARLSECLDMAVANGYISLNPASVVKVARGPEEGSNGERRYLTMEEIDKLLDELEGSWWYEFIYCMIFTGLRIGEISGLRWEDVDFKRGIISVSHSLYVSYEDGKKSEVLSTTKTRNAVRIIPMIGKVKKMLRQQEKKVSELKEKLGKRYRAKGELESLVFVTSMGSPVNRYNAQRVLTKVVDELNQKELYKSLQEKREPDIMEKIHPHALRHTFATICHDAKIDPVTAQKLMGHANYNTTASIYTHLDEKMSFDETEKITQYAEKMLSDNSNTQEEH